jgi:mannan endo-1,4-beta-mannosidase
MHDLARKGVMFGHQNTNLYGYSWRGEDNRSDVRDLTGDFPAVFGFDLMDVLRTGMAGENPPPGPERMAELVQQAHRHGGIATFSWHMPNPVTGTNSWDKTPAVPAILPGGDRHDFYKGELDKVATFFLSLKDGQGRPIPVWFRPFHEHTGDWFWWGKGNVGAEDWVALWRFTATYLREKGVHNVLMAYSTDVFESEEAYFEFYPGDDWVDMLSYDDYHSVRTAETRDQLVQRLTAVSLWAAQRGKLAALSETGVEQIPDPEWWTDVILPALRANEATRRISYFLVWRNANQEVDRKNHYYVPYEGHAASPDFRAFHADEATLFASDLLERRALELLSN